MRSVTSAMRFGRRGPLQRGALVAAAVGVALLLMACGESSPTAGPAQSGAATGLATAGMNVISPADAWRVIQAAPEGLVVLDVRTPQEYAQGHLPGAINVDFQGTDFGQRVGTLDRGDLYVVYCQSGYRSALARAFMVGLLFRRIDDIDGGIAAWQAAGLPVTTG